MAKSTSFLTASAILMAAGLTKAELDYSTAPPNLTALTGTELYYTWRPKAHIVPFYGRMQDPCLHYTDPQTGTYNVGYLWNVSPQGPTNCQTNDLVTYSGCEVHTISPGGANDPLAFFDGSVLPVGVDGYPTVMYSGVKSLPITWSMEYTYESETQSLAVSRDGGLTFDKLDIPPVITQPNSTTQPTAFRDPYVFKSYQLDALLNNNDTWYVAISGGVKGENLSAPGWTADAGPSQFLYQQTTADDFENWDFLGLWFHEAANTSTSDNKWAINWGFNMEVNNMQNLDAQGINNADGEMFHTFGSEWATQWDGIVRDTASWGGVFHRDMNWASGSIALDNTTDLPVFTPSMASRLDWGMSGYAAHGQILTADSQASRASGVDFDRWIVYVWMTGDFFGGGPGTPPRAQNWTGALGSPRELTVGYIENVVDNDLARELPGAWVVDSVDNSTGLLTLKTLKQTIAREPLAAMQDSSNTTLITQPGQAVVNNAGQMVVPFAVSPSSRYFVMQANVTFADRDADLRAGFEILASDKESTTFWYQASDDTFTIDRSNSSAGAILNRKNFDTRTETGLLRLFDIEQDGEQVIETLQLTVVVDNSIVEVYANDRFAMSTWIK